MKQFIAKCVALPVVEEVVDKNAYTVGRFYLFDAIPESAFDGGFSKTCGDDGVSHKMNVDYFSKYFARVFTDKEGYYVER